MILKEFIDFNKVDSLLQRIEIERKSKIIYPSQDDITKILNTRVENINVVILGQDPYHGEGQANGFAFAVSKGTKKPPSLLNIFKEIEAEYGVCHSDETLENLVDQGVLLMNTVWTVEAGKPLSHKNIGWEAISNEILENLAKKDIIFVAFGKNALNVYKIAHIEAEKILYVPHPSPLSCYRGFFGSNIFIKINKTLKQNNKKEVNW